MTRLGPDSGTLLVRTTREGPAAAAGHDLVLEVTGWSATFGPEGATLEADPRSLRVRESHGGVAPLRAPEKAVIHRTIDKSVLRGRPITFRSTAVTPGGPGGALVVEGELTLHGTTRPLRAYVDDHGHGHLTATVRVRQTDFGIRPYRAALGALRVGDEVEVAVHVRVPQG